ncbi:MAG: hypothetical protein CMF69_11320 [Magnetovibrio sp.]|nr:hypothetical protein [Magnetovibrio sp.]
MQGIKEMNTSLEDNCIESESTTDTRINGRVDFASCAIIGELLSSIVREMRRSMIRSSYSSIIYEGYDFSCVLLDSKGHLVAESGEDHPFHIVPVASAVTSALAIHNHIGENEILLHNDPYTGGTHLNDIAVIKPVYLNNSIAFYIVVRAHWGDIGGMSPGSLNGAATEILQEGLRLNYLKTTLNGDSEVMRLIFDNVRVTQEAISDFHSVIGIIKVAERRLGDLCIKYSRQLVSDSMADILDISERRIREAIRSLPDGEYSHVGFLDGNALSHHPLRVCVALSIHGDSLTADFSGSSPQVKAPLNAGPAIAPTSVLTVVKSFLDPRGSITSGTLRAFNIKLPSRSIVNASAPAPCGGLNEVRFASDAAVMGALGRAIPERMTGDVRGTSNHTYIGNENFIFYEYPSGGTGGWQSSDGNTAVRAFNEGENVSIQSSEVVETNFPLRIIKSEIRPDSGGPGRYRGGVGLVRQIEVLTEGTRLSVLSDRNVIPPAGVCGGLSGAANSFTVFRDANAIKTSTFPGKIANFPLMPGDIVQIETSGGGGWGPPSDREQTNVQEDLIDGYISSDGSKEYSARSPQVKIVRDKSIPISACKITFELAAELELATGDLIELVDKIGPAIRVWVDSILPLGDGMMVWLSHLLGGNDYANVYLISSFSRSATVDGVRK